MDVMVSSSSTVTLYFEPAYEAGNLLVELQQWTPAGGWSDNAKKLMRALRDAAGGDVIVPDVTT